MDIYLNPKQKQKDHAPDEFFYKSSSSSDDESSDEEELQPPQTEDEAPPQTQEQSDNQKLEKGRKIPQNQLQPLITNNPDRSVSPRLDHQTQSLQLHLASRGLLLTPSSLEQRRSSVTSEFQWTASNPSPQEKRRPPPIIYRSRDDFEAIPNVLSSKWIKNEFEKEKVELKAYYYGKAEDFMNKILRGEVFIDPKKIKFMEHKKFKALPKLLDRTPDS